MPPEEELLPPGCISESHSCFKLPVDPPRWWAAPAPLPRLMGPLLPPTPLPPTPIPPPPVPVPPLSGPIPAAVPPIMLPPALPHLSRAFALAARALRPLAATLAAAAMPPAAAIPLRAPARLRPLPLPRPPGIELPPVTPPPPRPMPTPAPPGRMLLPLPPLRLFRMLRLPVGESSGELSPMCCCCCACWAARRPVSVDRPLTWNWIDEILEKIVNGISWADLPVNSRQTWGNCWAPPGRHGPRPCT